MIIFCGAGDLGRNNTRAIKAHPLLVKERSRRGRCCAVPLRAEPHTNLRKTRWIPASSDGTPREGVTFALPPPLSLDDACVCGPVAAAAPLPSPRPRWHQPPFPSVRSGDLAGSGGCRWAPARYTGRERDVFVFQCGTHGIYELCQRTRWQPESNSRNRRMGRTRRRFVLVPSPHLQSTPPQLVEANNEAVCALPYLRRHWRCRCLLLRSHRQRHSHTYKHVSGASSNIFLDDGNPVGRCRYVGRTQRWSGGRSGRPARQRKMKRNLGRLDVARCSSRAEATLLVRLLYTGSTCPLAPAAYTMRWV